MLDLYTTLQGCKEQGISNIGFMKSSQNIAGVLTKSTNLEVQRYDTSTEIPSIEMDRRIIRKPKDDYDERH